MKWWSTVVFVFCMVQSNAQTFKGEAALPGVEQDGFYRVVVTPEIAAHLNDELSDIRLYNDKGAEVPYVLQQESPEYYNQRFVEYEIIENQRKSRCCTSLLLRNPKRNPINNVHLIIKNADAWRQASLQGSDDRQQWYALKDHFTLSAPNTTTTEEIKIVGFPWSNYEFYRLEIQDSIFAPLNILKAGYYEAESEIGKYTMVPAKVHTADSVSQKKTFITMTLPSLQFIDKIEVMVSGAKYYRRSARISEKRLNILKNGIRKEYYRPVQSFELTSGRTAIVELSGVRGQQFLIEIENHDNPPLVITNVKAFQLNRYLTAWLDASPHYTIRFGQPRLSPPVYDLGFFRDSIPKQLVTLNPVSVKISEDQKAASAESFFSSKSIVWVAIIVVMLVLGVMSVKLVRESADAKKQ